MTHQEIFNKVITHLRQQGRPSRVKKGDSASATELCMYAAPNGDACAVGCLINPKAYHPDIEGVGMQTAINCVVDEEDCVEDDKGFLLLQVLEASGIRTDTHTLRLLEALQAAHDGWFWGDPMPMHRFTDVADQFGLTIEV